MLNKFIGNLSPRERTAMIVTVIIITFMALDQLILGPILTQIKTLDSTIENKEALLKANMRIIANQDRVAKEVKLYEKYPLEALPSEDELASLLGQIEKMAAESEVYLIDSSPSGIREEGLLKTYIVKVDCEGLMGQVYKFMHSIEGSRKLLRIVSMRMRPKEKDSDIVTCRLSVEKIVLVD